MLHINFKLSMSFLSGLASLVEFLNEEKSLLLKLVEQLKHGNENLKLEDANFIYAAIYSYSTKHAFKLKLLHFHTSPTLPRHSMSTF